MFAARALSLGLAVLGVVRASTARAEDRVLWLREQGAVARAPVDAVVPSPVEAAPDHHADQARAALSQAREQFLAYAFREAATTLRVAAAEHVESLLRSERALAIEVIHWAGACAVLAGDREGARESFRRALAIAPESRLPPSVFPPEVETFFEEVRRTAVLSGVSVRTIRSLPQGARIEVDGREEGVTPVTLRLAPGTHYLRLVRAGYRVWTGPLHTEGPVSPDPEIVLSEATGRDLRAQMGDPAGLPDVPDAPTLQRLAREYQVARVVVALRNGGETVYPPSAPFPWAWVAFGAGVTAAGVGVGLYFLLRPPPTLELVSGSPSP